MSPPAAPLIVGRSHHDKSHHEHSAHCGCVHASGGLKLKKRLFFVTSGGICLLLSAVLWWLRPDQHEVTAAWEMIGAILTSFPIFADALAGLKKSDDDKGEFYMNQFIAIAVLACFASGRYMTAGMVASVLLVGHILEDRSMLGTNEAIANLLDLSRLRARRVREGDEEWVDTDSLLPGDKVRLRVGDMIPADGRVVSGNSTVDQAGITGESIPVEVEPGASVFAGTSNLTGVFEMEVTKTGKLTVLGKVRDLVEEAGKTRAPIVRLTEQYARYYMPLVLLVAGLVLFFTRDVQRAISMIVVSIPCTIVLAGPSAMVAALASAARMGILVKSVRFFGAANDIDMVVFDKTGTLTSGELRLAEVAPRNGVEENTLLALAAGIEQHSNHPIARAIVAEAKQRGLKLSDPSEIHEKHGQGLSARVNGTPVFIGRASWLREIHIALPPESDLFSGFSALHIAEDGAFLGTLYLSDTIRPEAVAATSLLRQEGIRDFMMLTGDRLSVAEEVAATVGIADFQAECLPEQKMDAILRLRANGRKVMVVGDGINDAPALAAGNLSVAMGALGSDVAIQTADVALMSGDLRRVPHFLELSERTLRTINQNIFCGLAFISVAILLSGFGLIAPVAAAFVHELGAFFVIINSARLLRFEGEEITKCISPSKGVSTAEQMA
jgi:Zn2+/Cd2+-exporting ATPase